MAGLPTTASSTAWAELFPNAVARDAIEVSRLRAAGAIVLGKTVADDFAYHGNGTSSLSGQVANPRDPTHTLTPGGSSAGSAVSVACGIAFAALGTDDGGSNRIPAQFSGVVGMKPTFGLVPRTGVIPTWPYLDTHGPLARHVVDAALLLEAIAGWSDSDGLSVRADRASYANFADDPLRGVRLGLVEAHVPRDQMSAESLAVWDRALDDLKGAGVEIVPFAPETTLWNVRQQFADLATKRGDVKPDSRSPAATANALLRYFQRHHGDARTMVRRGLAAYQHFYDVLPLDWEAMARIMVEPYEKDPAGQSFARSREALNTRLATQFREARIDAMIYPTIPFPAPRADGDWPDIRTTLGYGNWLGIPEVSVPSGFDATGLAAGNISFVGIPGSDARVLAVAHGYEQASRRFELARV
jgi:aspartyl-tRNA(Asn)/glutamyl-tRNA(Gln) amidotransferase subunit A